MTQMNVPIKQKQTHRHGERVVVVNREGGIGIGSLGLADGNCYR